MELLDSAWVHESLSSSMDPWIPLQDSLFHPLAFDAVVQRQSFGECGRTIRRPYCAYSI